MDMAMVALPLPVRTRAFRSFPLTEEKLYAVLPKQPHLAKRGTLCLDELRNEPFLVLRDGHCFRETTVAACKRARLPPKIIFENGQFGSILSMVGAGLAVSVIPAMAVENRRDCRLIPLADDRAARIVGVVTQSGGLLSRASEALIAHLTARST
jgi:LysR family hydrogen peroxide-inducible transcriptional activator